MERYYFTFGSNPEFPYGRKDYILIEAANEDLACKLFQALHPNRPGSSCLNCASIYTGSQFDEIREKYYKGIGPVEIMMVQINGTENEK